MAEILAGGAIHKAFRELGIEAKRTYKSSHEPYYQVWEIDKKDIHALEEEEEWQDSYGWWRAVKGSNMGTACSLFTVNGKELIAWDGSRREDLYNDWWDETFEEKAAYHHSFKEYEETMMPRKYDSLLDYFHMEIGVGMETNICALAMDLARANGKTMAGIFETYEG
jgi:hypothetical protein